MHRADFFGMGKETTAEREYTRAIVHQSLEIKMSLLLSVTLQARMLLA